MFIAYFDESGDDGYPKYSSDLFILSSVYLHHSNWNSIYKKIYQFRQSLRLKYRFPIKQEFHTREFIADKNPYHGLYSEKTRKAILFDFCQFMATLDVKVVNVVIDKKNIKRPTYHVLKNALTYNVQRIANDLSILGTEAKFFIITDEGRIGAMRDVTRKIQRINYIPSKFNNDAYRKDISNLIEDPLPKSSDQSYFIQLADMVAFLVSLYAKQNLCATQTNWNKRISKVLTVGDEIALLNILKPVLNTQASSKNEYGIVYYPRI